VNRYVIISLFSKEFHVVQNLDLAKLLITRDGLENWWLDHVDDESRVSNEDVEQNTPPLTIA